MSVEFIMERTKPRPPTPSGDATVVRLQPKNGAATGGSLLIGTDETTLPALMKRASDVGRQMRYFGLVAKRSSFNELVPSARRAGFILLDQDTERKEAMFQWSAGEPDFIFSVSFNDIAKASIVAESCRDIFGLILTGYSEFPSISVETNPKLENSELGHNAILFRDILLMFPDFDDLPAWTKCLEPHPSDAGGFRWTSIFDYARFWGGGVLAAAVICRAWKSISLQVSTAWSIFRDRWERSG
jgi:hypothetical protein